MRALGAGGGLGGHVVRALSEGGSGRGSCASVLSLRSLVGVSVARRRSVISRSSIATGTEYAASEDGGGKRRARSMTSMQHDPIGLTIVELS